MSAEFKSSETQFENPEASKLEDETNQGGSPRNQADRLAEKLAKKSSRSSRMPTRSNRFSQNSRPLTGESFPRKG